MTKKELVKEVEKLTTDVEGVRRQHMGEIDDHYKTKVLLRESRQALMLTAKTYASDMDECREVIKSLNEELYS